MRRINSLSELSDNIDIFTGIDITGNFKKLFGNPVQMPGCLFMLCIRGNCSITLHMNSYKLQEGSLIVVFPNLFFQINEQSQDCRFIFISFTQKLMEDPSLFSKAIVHMPSIFEKPVVHLDPKIQRIFHDYFMVLIRISKDAPDMYSIEHVKMIYMQLIIGLGGVYKENDTNPKKHHYNRNNEIVKDLMRIVIENYRQERNISFYADKMHLSPQHLSTTIKKVTGKTLTDIISTMVIKEAQAKLRSTELTIQEIAYSLNFPDISFFGKYFKRYTGMSPKQYRNME